MEDFEGVHRRKVWPIKHRGRFLFSIQEVCAHLGPQTTLFHVGAKI